MTEIRSLETVEPLDLEALLKVASKWTPGVSCVFSTEYFMGVCAIRGILAPVAKATSILEGCPDVVRVGVARWLYKPKARVSKWDLTQPEP